MTPITNLARDARAIPRIACAIETRIRPVGFFFHFLSGTKRFTIAGSRKWIKILIPNQLDRVLSKAYFGWVHF